MEDFLVDEPNQTILGITGQPDGVPLEVLDLLPGLTLFPGEDETAYQGLKQAFMADLAPGTPYETSLAQNLITLEWEAIRHRNLRDGLILAGYRDLAMGVFTDGKVGIVFAAQKTEEAENSAFALVNPDAATRRAAEDELAEYQITPAEILAKAYARAGKSMDIHERKLADVEIRRRRLRDDFDRLKAARAKPIEDAEVVEG